MQGTLATLTVCGRTRLVPIPMAIAGLPLSSGRSNTQRCGGRRGWPSTHCTQRHSGRLTGPWTCCLGVLRMQEQDPCCNGQRSLSQMPRGTTMAPTWYTTAQWRPWTRRVSPRLPLNVQRCDVKAAAGRGPDLLPGRVSYRHNPPGRVGRGSLLQRLWRRNRDAAPRKPPRKLSAPAWHATSGGPDPHPHRLEC